MSKQTFEIGTLLFRVKTGQPAVVLDRKETDKEVYGAPYQNRLTYKIFEDGRTFWKGDIELRAEYRDESIEGPFCMQDEPWIRPGPKRGC